MPRQSPARAARVEQPAGVVELPVATGAGPVEQATVAELQAAGRLGTPTGQVSLVMARRLDRSEMETGSGLAAVSRAHQLALETAVVGAKTEPDLLDELAARRDAKLGHWSPS